MKRSKANPTYKSNFDAMSLESIVKNIKDGLCHKLKSEGFQKNLTIYPIPSEFSDGIEFFIDIDSIKVESTNEIYEQMGDSKKFKSESKIILVDINDEEMQRQIELRFECYMVTSDWNMEIKEYVFNAPKITIFNDFLGVHGGSIENPKRKTLDKYILLGKSIAFTQDLIADQIALLREALKTSFFENPSK